MTRWQNEPSGTYRINPANVAGSLGRRVTIEAAPRSGAYIWLDGAQVGVANAGGYRIYRSAVVSVAELRAIESAFRACQERQA